MRMREIEQTSLGEEGRKRVRGYERVTGSQEPHKFMDL